MSNLVRAVSESKMLLIFMLTATIFVVSKIASTVRSSVAPTIAGWSWSAHPRTILIYVSDLECGCTTAIPNAIKQGIVSEGRVLLVSNNENAERFARGYGESVSFQLLADPSVAKSLSTNGTIRVLRVDYGFIRRVSIGAVLPEDFLK